MLAKQIVKKTLGALGYEILNVRKAAPQLKLGELPLIDVLELLLSERMRIGPVPSFIQVGAHDGASADPISELVKRHHLRGVLVEPQPGAFRQLVANYAGEPHLSFENALLGRDTGLATLYSVRDDIDGLPFWLSQSASLDRSVVANALRVFRHGKGVKAIPEDYESLIVESSVPSTTWSSLLTKYDIAEVDLLVIDAMGFDYELIKMFPFERVMPAIVHFEHSVLSPQDQNASLRYLADRGYSLAKVGVDTIAALGVKTRRWFLTAW